MSKETCIEKMNALLEMWGMTENRFFGKLIKPNPEKDNFVIEKVYKNFSFDGIKIPENFGFQKTGKVEYQHFIRSERWKLEKYVNSWVMFELICCDTNQPNDYYILAKNLLSLENDLINNAINKATGINNEIRSKETILDSLERKIDEAQSKLESLDKIQEEIQSKEKTLNNLTDKETKLVKHIETLNAETEKAEKLASYYRKIGLLPDLNQLKTNSHQETSPTENTSWSDRLDNITSFIASKNSIYTKLFIKSFTSLMCTHDMCVLAGRPGSGKTSFCRLYAESIGATVTVIPVKPNWVSSEDLLGYMNPVDKSYIATPFFKAISKARKDPNRLHIVVLDEMNIARPEYYFADLLSTMEDRSTSEPLILLNSINEEITNSQSKQKKQILSTLLNVDSSLFDCNKSIHELLTSNEKREQLSQILNCGIAQVDHKLFTLFSNSTQDIPTSISIPNNLRIIGTINIDETTNFFSPKVLDRIFVLRVEAPLNRIDIPYIHPTGAIHVHTLSPFLFGKRTDYPPFDKNSPIVSSLIPLIEPMRKLGFELSMRLLRQAQNFENVASQIGLNSTEILSTIIQSKILPLMIFDADTPSLSGEGSTKRKIFNFLIHQLPKDVTKECKDEYEKLIDQTKNGNNQVNYWAI